MNDQAPEHISPTAKLRARLKLLATDSRAKLWPAAAQVLAELDQVLDQVDRLEARVGALEGMMATAHRLEGPDCDN